MNFGASGVFSHCATHSSLNATRGVLCWQMEVSRLTHPIDNLEGLLAHDFERQ